MILLDWGRTARYQPGVVLVFGTGLVGGAVVQSMRHATETMRVRRLNWSWPQSSLDEVAHIETQAIALLAAQENANFTVFWAAGQSGFGTTTEGMQTELSALATVLDIARKIGATVPVERRHFIHTSSAGGLFEGQVCCGAESQPRPLRPYGHGKLVQEEFIRSDESLGQRHILRPSSVYGYAPNARRGLFTALASMALQGRTATIMGALTTQRDYVYASDIGRFTTNLILTFAARPDSISVETSLLASGRPAMIYEVINLIEARLGRPLLMKIDPRPENARNNTFLRSALPQEFKPTGLNQGIALTVAAVAHDRIGGAKL